MCLALAACGDSTPTTAINTTPPVVGTAPVTPFSPRVFSVVTADAATSVTNETTLTPGTDAQTPKLATDTPAAPGIGNNWLQGVPCKAPCWENITPGKTTPEEAQTLLKNNSSFGRFEINDPQIANKPVLINLFEANNITSLGFLTYHNEPKPAVVEIIKPLVQPYLLKDAISIYGVPSHIIVMEKTNKMGHGTGEYKTYFVYLNQGLILTNNYSENTNLNSESQFNEVYFFIPGQKGLDILDTQDDMIGKNLVNWEGFKDIKYYCRFPTETGTKNCN
ncbi:MAG: hypothetical protein BGO39_19025 [Chloroflexi bacterium 54-19]|nr:MAG: hypothetical protein BGO39_19025 [Chloroflexi bacterium 54-19]